MNKKAGTWGSQITSVLRIRNAWSCTPTPSYIFVHRDNLYLPLTINLNFCLGEAFVLACWWSDMPSLRCYIKNLWCWMWLLRLQWFYCSNKPGSPYKTVLERSSYTSIKQTILLMKSPVYLMRSPVYRTWSPLMLTVELNSKHNFHSTIRYLSNYRVLYSFCWIIIDSLCKYIYQSYSS
jgi:hypothetical protein